MRSNFTCITFGFDRCDFDFSIDSSQHTIQNLLSFAYFQFQSNQIQEPLLSCANIHSIIFCCGLCFFFGQWIWIYARSRVHLNLFSEYQCRICNLLIFNWPNHRMQTQSTKSNNNCVWAHEIDHWTLSLPSNLGKFSAYIYSIHLFFPIVTIPMNLSLRCVCLLQCKFDSKIK